MAFRSASAAIAGADGTSLAVAVPSGAAAGDIAIVAMYMESSAVVTPPTGFTQKADLKTDPSNRGRLQVFWKRLTAADTGTYTFTWTGSTWRGGGCVLFSGRIATGDPFDGFGTAETGSDVTTLNVSATPAAAGGDAVGVWTSWAAPESFTPPTNYTERIDGNSQLTIATRDNIAAGATGNVTATCSASDPINAFLGVLAADTGAGSTATAPTGIATAEAFGTATVSVGGGPISATATGIASAQAFGTPAAAQARTVSPTGIASAEAFGTAKHVVDPPFVKTVSVNGRYFLDQYGAPLLVRGDSPWSMFTNLSPTEMTTYLENRASYGVNTMLVSMIGATANGAPSDTGATYDGILPFTGGNPTTFNSAYWSRMDTYIAQARDLGITLMIYPMDGWNTAFSSVVFNPGSITNTQCQTYGQTLATRYASYPNIIWSFGGDYNEDSTINARYNACLTGIRAAGNSAPVTIQMLYEKSLSDDSTFWEPKVDFNFVYTYYVTYKGVKDGYDHVWSASPTTRPAVFSEGAYEDSFDPHPGTDLVIRRQAAWALTSGSPGEFTGQEGVWNFQSSWESALDTTAADQLKVIRDTFEALQWWKLVPDDSNQLVTAGRGTRITTDSATYPTSNTFVTAARAADGSLAVIYLPNASSAITVDMSKIGSSPTATWVDPTNGATSSATVGSTYSKGNNAAGSADWLLVLAGSSQINAAPTGIASGEAFGAATVTRTLTVQPTGIASVETLGTPTASLALTTQPTGIASAQAVGTPSATVPIGAQPTGIASAQALGTPAVSLILSTQPTGIATQESFGTPSESATLTVTAIGIASAEQFGISGTGATLTTQPSGIASAQAFGTPSATVPIQAQPTGIPTSEAVGTPAVGFGYIGIPTGIASAEQFGSPTVSGALSSSTTGISSAEQFGTPTANLTLLNAPSGIASAEQFGTPQVFTASGSQPIGIPSGEAFGTPTAIVPTATQTMGIGSAESFGTPIVVSVLTVSAEGVTSEEAFGFASTGGVIIVTPTGITSLEAFGMSSAQSDLTIVSPTGIPSAQTFGNTVVGMTVIRVLSLDADVEENRLVAQVEEV